MTSDDGVTGSGHRTRSEDRSGGSSRALFNEAIRASRAGSYLEATQLLREAQEQRGCSEVEALDLQARIYAQKGLFLNAESCWQRAKALDAGNPAYDEALTRLHRVAARPRPMRWVWLGLPLVVAGVWQMAVVLPGLRDQQAALEVSLSGTVATLETLRREARSAETATREQVQGVERALEDVGVAISRDLARVTAIGETNRGDLARAQALIGEFVVLRQEDSVNLASAFQGSQERLRAQGDSTFAVLREIIQSLERLEPMIRRIATEKVDTLRR